jgi:hypothetical protein
VDNNQQSDSRLLQLPDACLLAVLRYCTDNPRSLFSVARANTRLHQAAASATTSIKAVIPKKSLGNVFRYLNKHGQHIDSINLESKQAAPISQQCVLALQQPPYANLTQLSSLQFCMFCVHLRPLGGFESFSQVRAGVKQLRLHQCEYFDGELGLAPALALLPNLQHLSLVRNWLFNMRYASFPGSALVSVPHLTYLELSGGGLQDAEGLQGLTNLLELRLDTLPELTLQAGMLSGLQSLTRFQLHGCRDSSVFNQI